MIAGSLEIQMMANMARLQADMDTAKRSVGGAMSHIETSVASAKAALAGLAIGAGIGQFVGLIRGAIDAADHLNDLSKSTGIAVEQLAGLKLAAKQSGSDLDGVATSINKLSVNIGKDGEKFKALGVTAKDPLEAFKQLSDVFLAIKDPQLRAAVGAEALGKSWATAAPLLMEGGEEIQKMIDKGTALSHVNTEMAQQADAFNDKLTELTGTGGLMNSMTASLLPLLNLVADELLDMHKKSEGANDGFSLLAETFRAVVVLGGNVAFVFKGVGREIGGVAAQLAAFGSGDFKGALAIGDMMKSDAATARKDFDAWEAKAMNAGKKLNESKGYSAAKDSAASQAQDAKQAAAAAAAAKARAFIDGATGGGKDKADKVSEYQRLQQEITKVIAVQDLELLQGSKLAGSDKYRTEELQKITFAYATHKISQQERLALIGLTTTASEKMFQVEKQAAVTKANQATYAEQVEFAKELGDAEVALSKAREDGRAVLAEYSRAVDAENEFTALELSLVGQTEEAKKKAIALYRVELDLKKQLAAINGNAGFDGAQRAEAEALAMATAASAKAGVTSRIQLDAAEKAKQEQIDLWKQIDSTAESVFMDIAKNGTSAFKHLEEELKNGLLKLLYEMTVKPFIVQMATSFSGKDMSSALGGGSSNPLMSLLKGLSGGSGGSQSLGSSDFGGRADDSAMALDGVGDSLDKLGAASGLSVVSLFAQTIATINMGLAALVAAAQMAVAFVVANPVVAVFAAIAVGIAAIFSFGKEEVPNVLNRLDLFNQSLAGLPFQEVAYSSDEAAQGLRDVLYGLENATPAMRRLAGETIQLTGELMRAQGNVQGARDYDRNIASRGMSKEELAMYDYNQTLKDKIQAERDATAAASAGAAAAQAAEQAENTLAQSRWNIAGKLNVLLGRTTQLEFDRATALAATSDEASLGMLRLTYTLEDLHSAVDKNFAVLERSVAAEKKIADVRLKSATDLAAALKTTKDAISPSLDRASAQSQIAMYVALAKAGGVLPTAAALKPALDSIAKPSENLFRTFEDYALDQARTANDISDLAGFADAQVSEAQQAIERMDLQLETAKNQLDVLKGVDNSVLSVAEAVRNFEASMLAVATAQASAGSYSFAAPAASSAYSGGGGGYSGGGAASASSATAGMDSDIVAAYNAYYGRNPDQGGYDSFVKSGLTGDAMMQAILRASIADKSGADYNYALAHGFDPDSPTANFYHGKDKYKATSAPIEYFANGGDFGGGLRMVGERGPELEATGPSRITNTESLMSLFKSGGNNDALVAEIRALRAEVAGLRTAADKTAANTGKTADTLQGQQGVPFLVEIAQ